MGSRRLKVLTLNLAHGRRSVGLRVRPSRELVSRNLDAAAEVIAREQADVVALQEADGPCFFSGNFDHVRYLADATGFPHIIHGRHMSGPRFSYGTALLLRETPRETYSQRFAPSPPTLNKGLVAAHLLGSATLGRPYWVASIHLDFARAKVRRKQVWDIIDRFSEADEPLVLLGDFNTSLTGREKTLHHLLEELKLHVHHPESRELTTFPLRSTRIDWIVLSEHLHFRSHAVLPDVLSDHSAVTAEIEIARHS